MNAYSINYKRVHSLSREDQIELRRNLEFLTWNSAYRLQAIGILADYYGITIMSGNTTAIAKELLNELFGVKQ